MLNFNSIMVGSSQSQVMADFYTKVFDKQPDMSDGDWHGWQVGDAFFNIGGHDQVQGQNQDAARLMVNFQTTDVQGEFERIKALGAEVVKEPYEMQEGMWVATFKDPDGNYFQLMSPWESDAS